MPTATKSKLTVAAAAKHVSLVLGLPDTKRLEVALAQVASEEVERSSAFARRVEAIYNLLPAPGTRPPTMSPGLADIELVPSSTWRELASTSVPNWTLLHF
jgi:hypothetical protein